MKKDINSDKSHDLKDLVSLNYLHGYDYARNVLSGNLSYDFEKILVGNPIRVTLNTHFHIFPKRHDVDSMRHFFVDYPNERDFSLKPSVEVGVEDYTLSLYNLVNGYIAEMRRGRQGVNALILQQGYHLLGFSKCLMNEKVFSLIKKRKNFLDFCGVFHGEFGKKISECVPDLDASGIIYADEKERIRKEESPWRILGLNTDASEKECTLTYRVLSKKYHSDLGGNDELFARINWARDVLERYVF